MQNRETFRLGTQTYILSLFSQSYKFQIMHQEKNKVETVGDCILIKNLYFPCKIDIQIRLIQSMEIYDAPEKRASYGTIERSAGLANQFPADEGNLLSLTLLYCTVRGK